MKSIFILPLIILLCHLQGLSQKSIITIYDSLDNSVLSSAHVKMHYLASGKTKMDVADVNGRIIIEGIKGEEVKLSISFMGFKTLDDIIILGIDKNVYLEAVSVTLNSFVVTGQYSKNSLEKAVQRITIIDQKKIEKMAAVNLKDVLSNSMNIRLSQDNVLGSGMSLQGMGGQNVKILIDGVPVIGRLNGNIDLSQINLNDVERIEIIEGPMSVSFGTNALAGVINLITKTNGTKKLSITANSFNENIGQYNVDAGVSASIKNSTIGFLVGRNYFDGWVDGDKVLGEDPRIADSTRFKSWKPKIQYFGKANYHYRLKQGEIKYSLGIFNEKISNRGLPRAPYGETAFDDYYLTKRIDNSLIFNKKLNKDKRIQATIAYNDYQRIKNTFYKDLTTLEELQTENSGDQDTSKFNQWIVRSSVATSNDSVKVNYELGIDFNVEEAYGRRIENKKQQMGNYAFYMSLEYKPLKNTIIRPGLRYGYNTIYNAPLTPSINIKQTIKKINLRASYARGFRAPSLKELYFDFVDINHNIVGNSELKAEQSNNFNLSANYTKLIKSYLVKIDISSFYNKIENLITLAQSSTGANYTYTNIGDYKTYGLQLNNNISYKHLKFGLGGSYTSRYNRLSESSSIEKFSYTPEIISNVNYEFPKHEIFFSVFYKYTGKLPGFGVDGNEEIIQTYIDSYNTADLSIGKKFWKKRIQVVFGSKNLFNVKNVNSLVQGSVHGGSSGASPVAMGRTYFLKLSLNFEYEKNK